jgi:hypothetical protein
MPAALAGKTASVLGDADQPHTYTYIPDIGEGLAVLGEHPDAPGEVWHLANDPHTRTTRQLGDVAYHQAGQPRTKLRGTPTFVLRALGLVPGRARAWGRGASGRTCDAVPRSTRLCGNSWKCSTSIRAPELLLHAVGELGAEHDLGAALVGLELVEGGLELPTAARTARPARPRVPGRGRAGW